MNIKKQIDHIVYTVSDLDAAMDTFETLLGVRPIFGGIHHHFGTKNALINLDNGIYLELLAADTNNTAVPRPRWMGVDCLTKNQITRWALRSNHLHTDSRVLQEFHPQMGLLKKGERKTIDDILLSWELSMPLPNPEVALAPFLIDWSKTEQHPTEMLPDMNCSFKGLSGIHPHPEVFDELFEKLGFELRIDKGTAPALKLQLQCPNGSVTV